MIYVALLHSIVLGAGARVVMADLRAMAESVGFRSPRTLVATGNLIFQAGMDSVSAVEKELETAFVRDFGKHVDIIARSAADWIALAAGNPFPGAGASEAQSIVVRVMRKPLSKDVMPDLQRRCSEGETIHIVNGDLWIHFLGKPSASKLVSALTTKHLGVGTSRNWNTVRGLRDMIDD